MRTLGPNTEPGSYGMSVPAFHGTPYTPQPVQQNFAMPAPPYSAESGGASVTNQSQFGGSGGGGGGVAGRVIGKVIGSGGAGTAARVAGRAAAPVALAALVTEDVFDSKGFAEKKAAGKAGINDAFQAAGRTLNPIGGPVHNMLQNIPGATKPLDWGVSNLKKTVGFLNPF